MSVSMVRLASNFGSDSPCQTYRNCGTKRWPKSPSRNCNDAPCDKSHQCYGHWSSHGLKSFYACRHRCRLWRLLKLEANGCFESPFKTYLPLVYICRQENTVEDSSKQPRMKTWKVRWLHFDPTFWCRIATTAPELLVETYSDSVEKSSYSFHSSRPLKGVRFLNIWRQPERQHSSAF